MLVEVLIIIALTLLPFLELRASIPYGIFTTDLHWSAVFGICVFSNVVLGAVIYLFLNKAVGIFTKVEPIGRIYSSYVTKSQAKVKKYVDKYGELGVALFIAVPLPGSGVYSGALGAYVLGLDKKKFLKANIIGVLIAGIAVTAICLSGGSFFDFLIKRI